MALERHYEEKYAGEGANGSARVIAPTAHPTDRYQACLHHLPRLLRGRVPRILELAAGQGLVARSLLAAGLHVESYTVSERSEVRLEGLARSFATDPRVRVARIDAEQIGEGERGGYDAVVMVALIEHLLDPLRAMQGVRRLLAPGGFVYLDTPNVAKYTRRAKLLLGRFPSTASRDEGLTTYDGRPVDLHDEGHLHYFTFRSLSRMLVTRCGFARIEKLPYFVGRSLLGRRGDTRLARLWPAMFSELCVAAYC